MKAKCNQKIHMASLLLSVAYVEDQSDCIIVLYLNFVVFIAQ